MAVVTLLILSNDAAVCDALHRIKVHVLSRACAACAADCRSDQRSALVQGAPPARHQRWQVKPDVWRAIHDGGERNVSLLSLVAVVLCRSVQRHFKSKEVCCPLLPLHVIPAPPARAFQRHAAQPAGQPHDPSRICAGNDVPFPGVSAHELHRRAVQRVRREQVPALSRAAACCGGHVLTSATRDIDAYAAQRIMNMSDAYICILLYICQHVTPCIFTCSMFSMSSAMSGTRRVDSMRAPPHAFTTQAGHARATALSSPQGCLPHCAIASNLFAVTPQSKFNFSKF